jgi:hypothetical protein
LQEFAQRGGARLVQRLAKSQFQRLQICMGSLAALGKDSGEQTVYFLCDLPMNCVSRFFSSVVNGSLEMFRGRASQIC